MIELYLLIGTILGVIVLVVSHTEVFIDTYPNIPQRWKLISSVLMVVFWPFAIISTILSKDDGK